MNWINVFNLGTIYRHHKGDRYVVVQVVNYMDGPEGKMQELADPLVCYRDLEPAMAHVNGRHTFVHRVYARSLSEFTGMISATDGTLVQRFTREV